LALVTASPHFVAAGRIPVLSASTSAGAAYGAALDAGGMGLVTEDLNIPQYYIAASLLGGMIHQIGLKRGLRTAGITALGTYLAQYFDNIDPTFRELAEAFQGHGILSVARRWSWTTDDEPKELRRGQITAVRGSAGQLAGWLMSPDYLASTATQTPRPKFTCKHCQFNNNEPDSNVCVNCGDDIW